MRKVVPSKEESQCEFYSWRDYNEWVNSPKCNTVMSITFGLLIIGIFLGIVVITLYRTDFAINDGRQLTA